MNAIKPEIFFRFFSVIVDIPAHGLQGSLLYLIFNSHMYAGQVKYISESSQIDGLYSIAFRDRGKESGCLVQGH